MRNEILENTHSFEVQKRSDKQSDKHETTLQEFIINGIEKSKLASMIYNVSRKKKSEGIGYSEDAPLQKMQVREKLEKAP